MPIASPMTSPRANVRIIFQVIPATAWTPIGMNRRERRSRLLFSLLLIEPSKLLSAFPDEAAKVACCAGVGAVCDLAGTTRRTCENVPKPFWYRVPELRHKTTNDANWMRFPAQTDLRFGLATAPNQIGADRGVECVAKLSWNRVRCFVFHCHNPLCDIFTFPWSSQLDFLGRLGGGFSG